MGCCGSLFVLLLIGFGVRLMRQGRLGRLIDDHPICRRCSFDLFGIDSRRCPECGSHFDLGNRAQVRIGNRQVDRTRFNFGIAMNALALLIIVGGLTASAAQVRWTQFMPTSWLIADLSSNSVSVADRAMFELSIRNATLDDAQRDQKRDALVLRLLNWSAIVTPAIELELARLFAHGEFTPAQQEKVLGDALRVVIKNRSRVREGRAMLASLDVHCTPRFSFLQDKIEGRARVRRVSSGSRVLFEANGASEGWLDVAEEPHVLELGPFDLARGTHTLEAELEWWTRRKGDPSGMVVTRSRVHALDLIVSDDPGITWGYQNVGADQVLQTISVGRHIADVDDKQFLSLKPVGENFQIEAMLCCRDLKADMVARVEAVNGAERLSLGVVELNASHHTLLSEVISPEVARRWQGATAELRFVADEASAERAIAENRLWRGEFTVTRLSVVTPEGVVIPATPTTAPSR